MIYHRDKALYVRVIRNYVGSMEHLSQRLWACAADVSSLDVNWCHII